MTTIDFDELPREQLEAAARGMSNFATELGRRFGAIGAANMLLGAAWELLKANHGRGVTERYFRTMIEEIDRIDSSSGEVGHG